MPGRAIQVQRPCSGVHQAGRQTVRRPRIAQELRPHQAPRVTLGRRGPQHIKLATAGLNRRGLRQRRLARTRRAHHHQHAARADPGPVQQATDLFQLTAPPDD